eukprot:12841969-Alexandrium_andersonii.AAC.1
MGAGSEPPSAWACPVGGVEWAPRACPAFTALALVEGPTELAEEPLAKAHRSCALAKSWKAGSFSALPTCSGVGLQVLSCTGCPVTAGPTGPLPEPSGLGCGDLPCPGPSRGEATSAFLAAPCAGDPSASGVPEARSCTARRA